MKDSQLLRSSDVSQYVRANCDLSFPGMGTVERYVMTRCFDDGLYHDLLSDMKDRSGVEEFDPNTPLNFGDTVKYRGKYWDYEPAVPVPTPYPPPPTNTVWVSSPRFTSPAYETLWCECLQPWLSMNVIYRSIPFLRSQITDTGVIQFLGTSFRPADEDGINSLRAAILSQIQMAYHNLGSFCGVTEGLGRYPSCGDPVGDSCGETMRRKGQYRVA